MSREIATLRNPIGHNQLPVADPCFHYGEIGHLRAMCPKLVKTYPFDDVKCVDKPLRDCDKLEVNSPECINVKSCCEKGSKVKEKGVSTCTCSDVGSVDSPPEPACELQICTEEESSKLMTELTRTWDYEEIGQQVTNIQKRLSTNVRFWEQEL